MSKKIPLLLPTTTFILISVVLLKLATPFKPPPTPIVNKIAFVRDGDIYISDYNGKNITKIFETGQEELNLVQPEGLYMKLSPNGKYLAYLGSSGGLDSAIKVIDINQKKIIFRDVCGSAHISDFAWSPDSKKIVSAVNLKHDKNDFTTLLHLIDPFNESVTHLPNEEKNIEITQVEWPTPRYVYYSRLSYTEESFGMAGIVSVDTENGDQEVKNLVSWATPGFGFAISLRKDGLFFYAYPELSYKPDPYTETLLLPSLEKLSSKDKLNFMGGPIKVQWVDNYLVGIIWTYGSPDQSVVLYDLDNNQRQPLLDMGPSGSFHSINLLKQDGKTILVVWSTFDEKHSVSAYDLEKLLEARKKSYINEPLWKLTNAASPNL